MKKEDPYDRNQTIKQTNTADGHRQHTGPGSDLVEHFHSSEQFQRQLWRFLVSHRNYPGRQPCNPVKYTCDVPVSCVAVHIQHSGLCAGCGMGRDCHDGSAFLRDWGPRQRFLFLVFQCRARKLYIPQTIYLRFLGHHLVPDPGRCHSAGDET